MIFCGRSAERKAMINREHELPIASQAKALSISRGSVYYLPRPVSAADLAIMRRIDELHLDLPFAGSRMLRDLLNAAGIKVGRRHVATLMNRMGIEALYRRPNTSKPAPGHKTYPYLLRNLAVTRPNQVWAMDITYIPMARGFVSTGASPSMIPRSGACMQSCRARGRAGLVIERLIASAPLPRTSRSSIGAGRRGAGGSAPAPACLHTGDDAVGGLAVGLVCPFGADPLVAMC